MSRTSEKQSDDQVIQRCLDGETEAFGELVLKYQNRLFSAVSNAFGDQTEAEDVVQETFVQAFTKLASFRSESSFYTWLYRIAFNTSISRNRRKRPTVSVEQSREVFGREPQGSDEDPRDELERKERAVEVHAALQRISDEHRSILVLREIEDMDYEAISQVLDLPIGTVRSRLHRARLQLRTELERMPVKNVVEHDTSEH